MTGEIDGLSDQLCSVLYLIERCGIPVHVTSGKRTESHNAAVGGVPDSAHLTGEAADIRVDRAWDRYQIMKLALSAGVRRIGVGKDFVHLDVSAVLPQQVVWTYYE